MCPSIKQVKQGAENYTWERPKLIHCRSFDTIDSMGMLYRECYGVRASDVIWAGVQLSPSCDMLRH